MLQKSARGFVNFTAGWRILWTKPWIGWVLSASYSWASFWSARFEDYLCRGLRNRVVGPVPHPAHATQPNAKDILDGVLPVLEQVERCGELGLLERIAQQPGVRRLDPVLDAFFS